MPEKACKKLGEWCNAESKNWETEPWEMNNVWAKIGLKEMNLCIWYQKRWASAKKVNKIYHKNKTKTVVAKEIIRGNEKY